MVVPALKRLVAGRAGGAGGGFAVRRVRFTGVCIGWRSGASRICVVDSAGASVRLRAGESVDWAPPPQCPPFLHAGKAGAGGGARAKKGFYGGPSLGA